MIWGLFRLLSSWLGAALLLAGAAPVLAENFPSETTCHAAAEAHEDYARIAEQPWRWDCGEGRWSIRSPRAFLRFDLRGANRQPPDVFTTRLTRFDRMRLTVIGSNGQTASRTLREADMIPATDDWLMHAALPRLADEAEAVVVRIDGARHVGMLTDARVEPQPRDTPGSLREELLIAALCGMLCMPLLFNFAFYRVLRERFLMWHALAVVFMLAQTLVTSGLINRFAAPSLDMLCFLSAATWGGGIAAAALFSADFIEPGKLDPLHRKLTRGLALWIPAWTAFYLLADGAMRAWAPTLYFASFIAVLGVFAWVMAVARLRGSRAVNFQILAWMPIMLTGAVRIVSVLAMDEPLEMQLAQHVSLGLEIVITSLGVADRFMMVRRQRDRAWAQSRQFEELAERDALTGLFNRRGVEERFDELHAQGFDTMAVIDLDHFKQVNDVHGHAIGDEVLRAAALALAPDDDTLAVRIGGEEFLLLLRGKDVTVRAERRRQAIALRIAGEVPELQHVVTASMGLVQRPPSGALKVDFATLYAHCDRLLYEAKDAGRNRTMSEKVQSFGSRFRASAAA